MGHKNQKKRRGEPKVDEHHILFTHNGWNEVGRWGKLLRNHPYFRKIITIKKLHRDIHNQVKYILPPSNEKCKFIWEATEHAIDSGDINPERDTIEQRIDFFLCQLKLCCEEDDDYSNTIAALLKQREIVAKYYAKRSQPNPKDCRHKTPIYRERMGKFQILFPPKNWGVKGYSKVLSENSYFVVTIPKSLIGCIYSELHEVIKPKNGYSLKNVNQKLEHARKAKEINPREDSLEDRIIFLMNAFEEEGELRTVQSLRDMLEAIKLFYKRH